MPAPLWITEILDETCAVEDPAPIVEFLQVDGSARAAGRRPAPTLIVSFSVEDQRGPFLKTTSFGRFESRLTPVHQ